MKAVSADEELSYHVNLAHTGFQTTLSLSQL